MSSRLNRLPRFASAISSSGSSLQMSGVVLAHQQVVAVLHRTERARHQDRHEAVLDQLEVLDDVGPEQAERVRERREPEARSELLGDRRAADEVPPLEHERSQPGLGQVGAVGQAVVSAVAGPLARPHEFREQGWRDQIIHKHRHGHPLRLPARALLRRAHSDSSLFVKGFVALVLDARGGPVDAGAVAAYRRLSGSGVTVSEVPVFRVQPATLEFESRP